MKFRTEIKPQPPLFMISHKENLLLIGSCFAESIGQKLEYFKFPVTINPCGILFNPASIANAVSFVCQNKKFTEHELIQHDGLWHSFYHHGSFSDANKQTCLHNVNAKIAEAHDAIKTASTIIITLGTAFVWEHTGSKLIVSNCHKIPGTKFNQFMLSVEQIEQHLQRICDEIRTVNKSASIILTVSPVRYLINGEHQNQLSKATLLLAIEKIKNNDKIDYFPSYEIMMDDLRDYRFYADDMIHPSSQAVDYIWEKFSEMYFSTETQDLNKKIDAYHKALNHRILNPNSDSGIAFRKHIENLKNELGKTITGIV